MFQVNDDNSIYVTRGDIVFLAVTAEDDGKPYTFQPGEILRFKVFGKKDAESVAMQKDFPVTAVTQTMELFLDGEDTKIGEVISKPRDYWYEVELNPFDNPQTIIGYGEDGPCVFRLFPEGADIPEYVPDPEAIKVIDTELDMTSERPVQNQVIARAFANLQAGYRATHDAVAEKFVTPQMFGAVGDGVADDTEALQMALDSGFKIIDLLGKTYHITSPLVMHDGQTLQNGVIDGNYECTNGIECTSYSDAPQQRVSIINVSVRNFTQFGIYLKNCHDSAISRCFVENIITDVEGNATNGMCIEFCKNTIISECTVHNVNAPDDADGIHFLHLDTILDEVYSGNIVRNCITFDCAKRHYKIQEYGVTLDGCKMIEGLLGITVSANLVSIYDSFCTVKNCWFNAMCNNPVVIGSSNAESNHTYQDIVFIGNHFTLYGKNAQAAIVCADHAGNFYTNIIVTSNIFATRETTGEGCLYVRENFGRIIFNDNIMTGCYYAVFLRDVSDGKMLVCNSNIFDGEFALVSIKNTTVESVVNVGNYVTLSGGTRIVYLNNSTITRIKSDNLCPGTIYEYPYKAGSSSMRPTANANAGYMFYDWTLDKPIFLSADKTTWKDGAGNAVT